GAERVGLVFFHTPQEGADVFQVGVGGAGRGQGGRGGFEHATYLQDLEEGLSLGNLGQDGESLQQVGRAQRRDVHTRPVSGVQDSQGGQSTDGITHGAA